MNNEIKQFKLESVYKDAYIDRYRRLGYTVVSDTPNYENGVMYSVLVLQRSRQLLAYDRLNELEREIDELSLKAGREQNRPCNTTYRRRAVTAALIAFGILALLLGALLVVLGIVYHELYIAFGGWGAVFVGAMLIIICSFLRVKWRMRAIDRYDDAQHPGFGADQYSAAIELRLREADQIVTEED